MNWYLEVLKKYAVFDGRARRKEYWYFTLFNGLISIPLGLMDVMFETVDLETGLGLFDSIYGIGVLIPTIAVGIRRMHDVGKSGWYSIVPIYNFVLAIREGDQGENEYGPDPKNPEVDLTDHLIM